jgi:hypothetical protein
MRVARRCACGSLRRRRRVGFAWARGQRGRAKRCSAHQALAGIAINHKGIQPIALE